jgi:hypothetical protein
LEVIFATKPPGLGLIFQDGEDSCGDEQREEGPGTAQRGNNIVPVLLQNVASLKVNDT